VAKNKLESYAKILNITFNYLDRHDLISCLFLGFGFLVILLNYSKELVIIIEALK
jgi:hypothetical protein